MFFFLLCTYLQYILKEKSTPSAYALVCLFRTITTTINNSPMLLDALKKRQHSPELLIIDSDKSGDEECSDNEEEIDPTNVLSGRKHGLKLIKDVCTRWNSTFYMLQRCVLLKEAINHVLQESKYANSIPTSELWLAAEKLCVFLKPFQIVTDFLQGEKYGLKYPTLGCVSRYITTLLDGLQSHSPPIHWQLQSSWGNLPSVVQNVRSSILKDMRARWDPTDILLGMGAITHPGHKSLSWLNATNKQTIIDQLCSEMFAISHPNADTAGAGAIITLDPDVIEPPAKRRATEADDDFNVLFGCSDNTEQEAVHALDDDIDDEMQRYLKEVEINFRKDDPLMWWKCHETFFPIISKLARKYLAIPASTAPSERVFSTAKIYYRKKDGDFCQIGSVTAFVLRKTLNFCSI